MVQTRSSRRDTVFAAASAVGTSVASATARPSRSASSASSVAPASTTAPAQRKARKQALITPTSPATSAKVTETQALQGPLTDRAKNPEALEATEPENAPKPESGKRVARDICAEDKNRGYVVEWEGTDPSTGKPWPRTWEPHGLVDKELIERWKLRMEMLDQELLNLDIPDEVPEASGAKEAHEGEEAQNGVQHEQTETDLDKAGISSTPDSFPVNGERSSTEVRGDSSDKSIAAPSRKRRRITDDSTDQAEDTAVTPPAGDLIVTIGEEEAVPVTSAAVCVSADEEATPVTSPATAQDNSSNDLPICGQGRKRSAPEEAHDSSPDKSIAVSTRMHKSIAQPIVAEPEEAVTNQEKATATPEEATPAQVAAGSYEVETSSSHVEAAANKVKYSASQAKSIGGQAATVAEEVENSANQLEAASGDAESASTAAPPAAPPTKKSKNQQRKRTKPAAKPSHPDDDQIYPAKAITGDRPGLYRVAWENDPVSGEAYQDTWEPKHYVSRDLVAVWKTKQKEALAARAPQKKRGRAAKKAVDDEEAEGEDEEEEEGDEEKDDDDVFAARAIVGERASGYLVAWEKNAETGDEYDNSWEPKCNVSDDLIAEWEEKKREMAGASKQERVKVVVKNTPQSARKDAATEPTGSEESTKV